MKHLRSCLRNVFSIIHQAVMAEEQYKADLEAIETVSRHTRHIDNHALTICPSVVYQPVALGRSAHHQVLEGSRRADQRYLW
jgi:hypothetical protein